MGQVMYLNYNLIAGNYYSIRCDHQMAIMYFQRALKLNPKYLAAWTLMGHEFMELKNTNAAIQSYRKAVGEFSCYVALLRR